MCVCVKELIDCRVDSYFTELSGLHPNPSQRGPLAVQLKGLRVHLAACLDDGVYICFRAATFKRCCALWLHFQSIP